MHNNGFGHIETFDKLAIQRIRTSKAAKYGDMARADAKKLPEQLKPKRPMSAAVKQQIRVKPAEAKLNVSAQQKDRARSPSQGRKNTTPNTTVPLHDKTTSQGSRSFNRGERVMSAGPNGSTGQMTQQQPPQRVNRDMAHLDFGVADGKLDQRLPQEPFGQQIMIEGHGRVDPDEQQLEDHAVYDEDDFEEDYDGEEFLGDPDDDGLGEYGFEEADHSGGQDGYGSEDYDALLREGKQVHLSASQQ